MTKFKKTTAILVTVCLCMCGIFSKAQARVSKTLDGKESRFVYSEEETWSPSQNLLSATIIADEWWLDNMEVTLTDDIFYYRKMNLCFPVGASTISSTGTPGEPCPADAMVATYLIPDFKQRPLGLSPDYFIAPFADSSGQIA